MISLPVRAFLITGLVLVFSSCTSPHSFELGGMIRYQDRIYGLSGFSATSYKPVRYAIVQAIDNGVVVATTRTDSAGSYNLAFSGSRNSYLRILAQTDATTGIDLQIRDPDSGSLLSATKPLSLSVSEVSIDLPYSHPMGGAFNILDTLSYGMQYAQSYAGSWPSGLKVYWREGNVFGTGFCTPDLGCPQGEGIYVLGGDIDGDSDHYDDDVLLHEFGHFLEYHYTTLDSMGGTHYLHDTYQDLRLSWSEGWGNFISGAIKGWIKTQYGASAISSETALADSYYIDTIADTIFIAYDFSTAPDYNGVNLRYASNEAAVASVLWGVHDNLAMQGLWNSATDFLSTYTSRPSSLETFWLGWHGYGPLPADALSFNNQFALQSIDYTDDGYEDDNTSYRPLSINTTEIHTLISAMATDTDRYSFTATSGSTYLIETFDLTNGADTELQLMDNGFNNITSNNNHNGTDLYAPSLNTTFNSNTGCQLASRILYTATYTGLHYITVSNPLQVPYFAGRYGSYSIRLIDHTAAPATAYIC